MVSDYFRFNFYPSGIFRMNSSDRFSGSGPHTTGKCGAAMGINAINAIARSITGSVLAVSYGNLALDGDLWDPWDAWDPGHHSPGPPMPR